MIARLFKPFMSKPTNASRFKFAEILEGPSGYAKFLKIMARTTKEETYLAYFKEAMDRAFGRAKQTLEHSGDVGSRLIFEFPKGSDE